LKSSGSKPSGGRDRAKLGSVVVHRASHLFYAFFVFVDAVWSTVLLPHTCFLLSCMHSMVETKMYPEKIYIGKIAQLVEYFIIKGESTLLNN
jgi:hypothetical protein